VDRDISSARSDIADFQKECKIKCTRKQSKTCNHTGDISKRKRWIADYEHVKRMEDGKGTSDDRAISLKDSLESIVWAINHIEATDTNDIKHGIGDLVSAVHDNTNVLESGVKTITAAIRELKTPPPSVVIVIDMKERKMYTIPESFTDEKLLMYIRHMNDDSYESLCLEMTHRSDLFPENDDGEEEIQNLSKQWDTVSTNPKTMVQEWQAYDSYAQTNPTANTSCVIVVNP